MNTHVSAHVSLASTDTHVCETRQGHSRLASTRASPSAIRIRGICRGDLRLRPSALSALLRSVAPPASLPRRAIPNLHTHASTKGTQRERASGQVGHHKVAPKLGGVPLLRPVPADPEPAVVSKVRPPAVAQRPVVQVHDRWRLLIPIAVDNSGMNRMDGDRSGRQFQDHPALSSTHGERVAKLLQAVGRPFEQSGPPVQAEQRTSTLRSVTHNACTCTCTVALRFAPPHE